MSNEIQHIDDDYLHCDHYQAINPDESGFHRFDHLGKYYFSFIDHGIVVLRSEGYSSESGRENGIASVQKHMDNEAMYSTKMLPDGRWVLSLKAGNHQEIARSCPEATEEEVQSYLPSQRAAFAAEFLRLASIEAGSVPQEGVAFASDDDNAKESDDYMICREYEEKYSAEQVEEGNFIRFKHENTGSFYFAWVSDNGEIIMRSEAYPTAGARDNGLESVRKNRALEERYKIEEQRGLWYLILKAGNHQEIGRSCPFKSEEEAKAWLPSERAKAEALRLATLAAASTATSSEEDDYMICREYEEKFDATQLEDGFIKFHHENTGKYYFAWYTESGDVILRSEGYPNTAARDNGLESVKKNREIKERFKVEEKRGLYYLVLKAGNHQEIGRSCPKKSEDEVWALIAKPEAGVDLTPLAAVAAAIPLVDLGSDDHAVSDAVVEVVAEEPNVDVKVEDVALAAPVVAAAASLVSDFSKEKIEYKAPDKADDYLACDEYKGHAVSDRTNNIAFFKHKDGQFYFVVYHKDGSVRLRSEGFKTAQQRDQELKGVIKHMNEEKMYETLEKGSHVFHILKDTTGREVARSCAEKPGAIVVPMAAAPAAVVASVVAEVPKAVATAAATTATTGSGFKWWYLLPLLLIPLFFMWKGCDGKKDEVSTTTPQMAPIEEAAPAPVEEAPVAETTPVAAAPSCDLNWILFDFDKYDITSAASSELQVMAKILQENPSYKGILNAHTDSRGDDAYNQKLSENRANAAKAILVQAGIDAARITTTAKSEAAPIAKNTDDDAGRRFNRRVELFVVDNDGKEICKSIPPNVPSDLKTN